MRNHSLVIKIRGLVIGLRNEQETIQICVLNRLFLVTGKGEIAVIRNKIVHKSSIETLLTAENNRYIATGCIASGNACNGQTLTILKDRFLENYSPVSEKVYCLNDKACQHERLHNVI